MPFLLATRPLGVPRLLDRVLMLTRATFLPVQPIAGVQVLAGVAGDALRLEYFTGTLGHDVVCVLWFIRTCRLAPEVLN